MDMMNTMQDPAAMEQDILQMGKDEQRSMDDLFSAGAPTGRFTVNGLNALVGAFNDVLVSMGVPDPYPEFTAGTRQLPGAFVRGLAMVADAAEQAGVPNPVKLDGVEDDQDLVLMAAKLEKLAANNTFIEAMTGGGEEPVDAITEGAAGPEDAGAPVAQGDGEDLDALFMGRM